MPLVCPRCGSYALSNSERSASATRCSVCQQTTEANIFPLFVVTGASGSGKTFVIPELRCQLPECLVFDKDLLWGRAAPDQFANNWLRIAYSVAQGGRHTVICGTLMPGDLQACEDRSLVGTIHFLNQHCADDVREQRLRERPVWRQASDEAFIAQHKQFARWLLENAATAYEPPMPTVDTTHAPVSEVAGPSRSGSGARWVDGQCTSRRAIPQRPSHSHPHARSVRSTMQPAVHPARMLLRVGKWAHHSGSPPRPFAARHTACLSRSVSGRKGRSRGFISEDQQRRRVSEPGGGGHHQNRGAETSALRHGEEALHSFRPIKRTVYTLHRTM